MTEFRRRNGILTAPVGFSKGRNRKTSWDGFTRDSTKADEDDLGADDPDDEVGDDDE